MCVFGMAASFLLAIEISFGIFLLLFTGPLLCLGVHVSICVLGNGRGAFAVVFVFWGVGDFVLKKHYALPARFFSSWAGYGNSERGILGRIKR